MIEGMDLGGGGHAWYAYDIGKQRTRKRIERLGGAWEERLYLGGMELYRRYGPSGAKLEEIETQHLFVDDQRVLLVDDVIDTDNSGLGTGVLCKYQYGNHLGSVSLELDETAQIIGREELHPYGTTAYYLRGSVVHGTVKRYRYTGMERDEESGLSYHSARYYLPWLGRWGGSDPLGSIDGPNLYLYTLGNPIGNLDVSGNQTLADGVRFARAVHAIDPDAFNGGVSIFEGRWIPTPTSLSEHRLFRGFAETAMTNVRARVAPTIGSEDLYRMYRAELNTLLRADVEANGPMASLLEIAPRGTGTQLRFRAGIFEGQFLEFAHDISRAEIGRFGTAAELAIELSNLAPVGHTFHRAFLHIEQALNHHGELTAESVRELIRTYAAETRAAASSESSAAAAAAGSATGTASAAASGSLPSLIAETGGSASILGIFGGLAGVAIIMLTYNQLRDAESDAERGEILFDVVAPMAVQLVEGVAAGIGVGLVVAVSSHATTSSHWCEDYSGGCAALSRYETEYPGASEEDLATLHGLLELRARDERASSH
jgi:RHS repeat-associated protein